MFLDINIIRRASGADNICNSSIVERAISNHLTEIDTFVIDFSRLCKDFCRI